MRRQEVLDVTRTLVQFYDKTPSGDHEEIVVTPREWALYSSKHFDRNHVKDGNLNKGVDIGYREDTGKHHQLFRPGSCALRGISSRKLVAGRKQKV